MLLLNDTAIIPEISIVLIRIDWIIKVPTSGSSKSNLDTLFLYQLDLSVRCRHKVRALLKLIFTLFTFFDELICFMVNSKFHKNQKKDDDDFFRLV